MKIVPKTPILSNPRLAADCRESVLLIEHNSSSISYSAAEDVRKGFKGVNSAAEDVRKGFRGVNSAAGVVREGFIPGHLREGDRVF